MVYSNVLMDEAVLGALTMLSKEECVKQVKLV